MNYHKYPNLYIVGAAKCATTSLADFLRKNSSMFYVPINKEPNYFVFRSNSLSINNLLGPVEPEILRQKTHSWSVPSEVSYLRLYESSTAKWNVDASVRYLYYPKCAKEIKSVAPHETKIVICIRQPSKRAISHYIMMRHKYKLEDCSLDAALERECERIEAGWDFDWHYLNCSRYSSQIIRYIEEFGRDRVHIISLESLNKSRIATIFRLMKFLDIRPSSMLKLLLNKFPVSNKSNSNASKSLEITSSTKKKLIYLDEFEKAQLNHLDLSVDLQW